MGNFNAIKGSRLRQRAGDQIARTCFGMAITVCTVRGGQRRRTQRVARIQVVERGLELAAQLQQLVQALLHLVELVRVDLLQVIRRAQDRKSTRLNSSHSQISYAVFCLKKKKKK